MQGGRVRGKDRREREGERGFEGRIGRCRECLKEGMRNWERVGGKEGWREVWRGRRKKIRECFVGGKRKKIVEEC